MNTQKRIFSLILVWLLMVNQIILPPQIAYAAETEIEYDGKLWDWLYEYAKRNNVTAIGSYLYEKGKQIANGYQAGSARDEVENVLNDVRRDIMSEMAYDKETGIQAVKNTFYELPQNVRNNIYSLFQDNKNRDIVITPQMSEDLQINRINRGLFNEVYSGRSFGSGGDRSFGGRGPNWDRGETENPPSGGTKDLYLTPAELSMLLQGGTFNPIGFDEPDIPMVQQYFNSNITEIMNSYNAYKYLYFYSYCVKISDLMFDATVNEVVRSWLFEYGAVGYSVDDMFYLVGYYFSNSPDDSLDSLYTNRQSGNVDYGYYPILFWRGTSVGYGTDYILKGIRDGSFDYTNRYNGVGLISRYHRHYIVNSSDTGLERIVVLGRINNVVYNESRYYYIGRSKSPWLTNMIRIAYVNPLIDDIQTPINDYTDDVYNILNTHNYTAVENYYNNTYINSSTNNNYTYITEREGDTVNNNTYNEYYSQVINYYITNNSYQDDHSVTYVTEINNYEPGPETDPGDNPTPTPTPPPSGGGDYTSALDRIIELLTDIVGFLNPSSDSFFLKNIEVGSSEDSRTTIWDFLGKIFDKLMETLDYLNPFSDKFFLKVALIPENGFLDSELDDLKQTLESRIPILVQLGEISDSVASISSGYSQESSAGVRTLSSESAPLLQVTLPEIYGGGTYTFVDFSFFDQYKFLIHSIIKMIATLFFVSKTYRRIARHI